MVRSSTDLGPGRPQRSGRKEVSPEEAGPVLKQYVRIAPTTRPYFGADQDAAVADFVAEADRHPVFKLLDVGEAGPAYAATRSTHRFMPSRTRSHAAQAALAPTRR